MSHKGLIAVVGGGVAGLAAALELRADHDVVLLEASESVGGKLRTTCEHGYLLEWGPNSFLGSARHVFSVIEDLGIDPHLTPAYPSARKRYIYHRGALRSVPSGPISLLTSTLLSPLAKIRALSEPLIAHHHVPHETVSHFFARRFGSTVAERLVAPFVSGIYAGDANELEVEAAFPRIASLEEEYGSVVVGAFRQRRTGPRRRGSFSFADGMQTLADAASATLGPRIRLNTAVHEIERAGHGWRLQAGSGDIIEAAHVILAVPAHRAAKLLRGSEPFVDVAGLLATVPYASVGLVHLGCARGELPRPLDGFGFLSVPGSGLDILGSLWPSSVFPDRAPNGKSLMSVFLGGQTQPGIAGRSPQELIDLARASLGKAMGGVIEPELARAEWIERAIPQFVRGHRRKVAHLEQRLSGSGVTLAGNYLTGVSVDQAIASGVRAAKLAVERI